MMMIIVIMMVMMMMTTIIMMKIILIIIIIIVFKKKLEVRTIAIFITTTAFANTFHHLLSLLPKSFIINILQLIFQIPQSHRNVFTYISAFLRELLLYSNDNKLDAKTLGEYNLFASYFFRYVFAQYHIVDTFIREISMKSC